MISVSVNIIDKNWFTYIGKFNKLQNDILTAKIKLLLFEIVCNISIYTTCYSSYKINKNVFNFMYK